MATNEEKHMDRRDFLSTITALPLLNCEPWFPSDGVQELILPHDLAYGLERHCSLPLEQRLVRADEAAKIADEINIKYSAVFLSATDMYSDDWKLDYSGWSWFHTQKRWKQMWMVEQIANAGEFNIVKKDEYFVLQTTRCKLAPFRTSERRLIVDYDNEWSWHELGGGWPTFIRGNELIFQKQDWFILAIDVFGIASQIDYFDDDVLKSEIAIQLADRLRANDIDPDPWLGIGYGWVEIADWLARGETLFVPFPNQPMI
jgi:hypothetical protein